MRHTQFCHDFTVLKEFKVEKLAQEIYLHLVLRLSFERKHRVLVIVLLKYALLRKKN